MAQSQLALYNLALSLIGADFTISAVSEESVPAEACELWYENVRQVVLRTAHWNSVKRYARLVEEAERDNSVDWTEASPEPGFVFSYALPASMLAARYLTTFGQFSLSTDEDKRILSANEGSATASEAPILCYTIDLDDPTAWEPDLYQVMAYSLAAQITMGLTGKASRARANLGLAYELILSARANTANEMNQRLQATPTNLLARGYNYAPVTPYIYPYGSFFTGTGAPLT